MFDALLALGVLGGIAALWSIGQGRGGWLGFGLALAFGVYAKGPVILVHLLPVLLTMPYWAPNPPKTAQIAKGFGGALLIALALIALWLVPTLLTATPEFRTELLWTQSAARVAGGMAHDRPFWFLIALLPLLLFPWGWSVRLWAGFTGTWSDPAIKLCTIWAVSTLILFSLISGKQAHYLLPAYPAMALLFAHASTRAKSGSLAWAPLLLIATGAGTIGLGLIPAKADLAQLAPYWPLTAFAALCLILSLLIWRLPRIPGHLLAGIGLTLGLHGIIATTGLYAAYDGQSLANTLAAHEADGLASHQRGIQCRDQLPRPPDQHCRPDPRSAKPDRLGTNPPQWHHLWSGKRKPADGSAAAGFPFLRTGLGPLARYFSGINPFGLNLSTNNNTAPNVTNRRCGAASIRCAFSAPAGSG